MKISVVTPDGNFFTVEVDGAETVRPAPRRLIPFGQSGRRHVHRTSNFSGRHIFVLRSHSPIPI
jgi:hypothetical protein